MGYIDNKGKFVTELDKAELQDARSRAEWLAQRWFTQPEIFSIDLGEVPAYGYVSAIIGESCNNGERRIRFTVGEGVHTLFTARYKLEGGFFILKSWAGWVGKIDHNRGAKYVGFADVQQFADQYFTYLKRGETGDMWGELENRPMDRAEKIAVGKITVR